MSIIGTTSIMVAKSSVTTNIPTAAPFVSRMKLHACFFETKPEGMGLFLELALSTSVSATSFRMYMPTAIINVMKGGSTVLWISIWISVSVSIIPRMPGIKNRPAAVAKE
jgi:hypothetical protein